ncbi:hypothetical protein [Bradyrhizobium sp. BRP19]|uniref:hypothetical protein n=1 Tax=Bradyrhizobium sp. BRP19 TaxID=2793823 RepID=UPI001CD5532E|nr:hypothetical protein [Bradyrhizobium sp. BRP19]
MIQEHLAMMRRHVADGKEQVAGQREVVDKIKAQGGDASEVELLLKRFQEIQDEHVAHRDRLEAVL